MSKPYNSRKDEENMVIIIQAVFIAVSYFLEWLFAPREPKKNK